MNLLPDGLLRVLSLFGEAPAQASSSQQLGGSQGIGPVDSSQSPSPQFQNPGDDVVNKVLNLYHPRTEISDQYKNLLLNQPQRGDPGMMSKIGGLMSAAGAGVHPFGIAGGQPIGFVAGKPGEAQEAYDQSAYPQYNRDLMDWQNKAKALGAGATEEEKSNANQKGVLLGGFRQAVAEDRANTYATRVSDQDEASRRTAANNAQRTEIYRDWKAAQIWKLEHPTAVMKEDDQGRIISIDPKTNKSQVVTDKDTGIPVKSSNLPMEERIKLQIHGRLQEIGAQGANAITLENTREGNRETLEDIKQPNRMDVVDERGAQTRETNAEKPTTASGRQPLSTQENARLLARAKEAILQHPEWKDYIQISKSGTQFTFSTPAWYKGGADKSTMDQIHDYLYGAKGTQTPPRLNNATPETRVEVKDKTGKVIGTVTQADSLNLDKTKYDVGNVVK